MAAGLFVDFDCGLGAGFTPLAGVEVGVAAGFAPLAGVVAGVAAGFAPLVVVIVVAAGLTAPSVPVTAEEAAGAGVGSGAWPGSMSGLLITPAINS